MDVILNVPLLTEFASYAGAVGGIPRNDGWSDLKSRAADDERMKLNSKL